MNRLIAGVGFTRANTTGLFLIALAAGLTTATALPPGALRGAIAFPIALVLPGYALVAAVLGPAFDRASMLAVASMSSIAFYALASLVLYSLSVRLTAFSVALTVDALVLAAVCVLVVRFNNASDMPANRGLVLRWHESLRLVALAVLIGAIAMATFAAHRLFATAQPPPFTQFAFGGEWSRLSTAPSFEGDSHLSVKLQLLNETRATEHYLISPALAGRHWASREVALAPGAQWSGRISGLVRRRPCLQRLTVSLDNVGTHRRITQLAVELRSSALSCGGKTRR